MANENEYTELIAGAHYDKPKFKAFVYLLTSCLKTAQERLKKLRNDFDIDLAEGAQLDAVGVRVGLSRRLRVPISDSFFAFDDDGGPGFDLGIWFEPSMSASGFIELPDDLYRSCLKFKVALNHYDGSNQGAQNLVKKFVECFHILDSEFSYIDNQDMSVTFILNETFISPSILKIIESKILPLNNAGVGINIKPVEYQFLADTQNRIFSDEYGKAIYVDIN